MDAREEKNRKQREYREKNKNLHTKQYEKTEKGFLMRLYRNMESRVTGVQSKKAHLYKDLDILERSAFYDWATDREEFHALFRLWIDSSYERKLTPSVDRVDSSKGYSLDNMEWVTHSENSRRGAVSRHSGVKNYE
jgi:hypothetical protein|tara:strand:- start:208 stop:615 length:408 start_codon:yes stop_codon:yes gene_type:complete